MPRRLSIFTYLEWCLGAAPDYHREFHKTFLETEFNEDHQVLLVRKRLWEVPSNRGHWNTDWNRIAYLACSELVDGFEGDKEAFMGNYSDLSRPLAVETGQLTGRQGKWNDSIGSLKKDIQLAPGEEKTIHFFLGAEKDSGKIFSILEGYRQPGNIESAYQEMQHMSDDLLWLPFVTIQYLKETANWSVLDEEVPFYDDPEPRPLLHHCLQAVDRVLERFSGRGLPLILAGDWNDGLSAVGLKGKGESIWLAHFLYYILNQILPLLKYKHLCKKADYYRQRAAELKNTINEIGWDGNWFWRASKDNGQLIGSHQNKEGKIYLNAQSWSVIAKSTSKAACSNAISGKLFREQGWTNITSPGL